MVAGEQTKSYLARPLYEEEVKWEVLQNSPQTNKR